MAVDKEGFVAFKKYINMLVLVIIDKNITYACSIRKVFIEILLKKQCDIIEQNLISILLNHVIFRVIT